MESKNKKPNNKEEKILQENQPLYYNNISLFSGFIVLYGDIQVFLCRVCRHNFCGIIFSFRQNKYKVLHLTVKLLQFACNYSIFWYNAVPERIL